MQQQHQVRLLPLAPKPLCSPHPYDPAYQVEVQLDEPLWVPRVGPQVVAMAIMALCVQLDSIFLTNTPDKREEDGEVTGGSRRVRFEQTLTSQATAVLQQMREQLRRAGRDEDVETYLRESGLSYLFPRVELYLQEPEQDLTVASPIMEGYFSHLTVLNNVLTMAHQLNTDVQSCASHKYIAHQTALLYQCIGHIPQFSHYKKEIEGKFTAIKTSCTPSSSSSAGLPPRLSPELQQWLVEMTRRLVNDTSSLHPSLLSPLTHVLSTIENISSSQ